MADGWEGIIVPSKLHGVLRTDAPVLFIGLWESDTAIRAFLGVDPLGCQTVEGLVSAVAYPHDYCAACFTGDHPARVTENVG